MIVESDYRFFGFFGSILCMTSKKKVLLSGIKPTGVLHVGNYFGAMRQFIDLQDEYESYIFIANYHAMTSVQDAEVLRKQTFDIAVDYLAAGLDPKKVSLFVQSDVPEVTELTWMLNCITTVPYLQRAHAYKDSLAKDTEPNVGTFDYPILMAADILIQDADVVPVGSDQKQHIEYARDIAQKFNRIYGGDVLHEPEPYIMDDVAIVPGTDGRKMSKSYGNVISLFATDEVIRKAVMSIPTDSLGVDEPKDPETCNVFALHKLFSQKRLPEIEARYREGGMGYKETKDWLVESVTAFITPLRTRREELLQDPAYVYDVLEQGGKRASIRAREKMAQIYKTVGLNR